MKNYKLSWVYGDGERCDGGREKKPTWENVAECLRNIKDKSGSTTLELESEEQLRSIQMLGQKGSYVVSYMEDNGVDCNVRAFKSDAAEGEVEVLGDLWDASMICKDIAVVVKVFNEFYHHGYISEIYFHS